MIIAYITKWGPGQRNGHRFAEMDDRGKIKVLDPSFAKIARSIPRELDHRSSGVEGSYHVTRSEKVTFKSDQHKYRASLLSWLADKGYRFWGVSPKTKKPVKKDGTPLENLRDSIMSVQGGKNA